MFVKWQEGRLLGVDIIGDATMKHAILGDPAQMEKALKTVEGLRSKICKGHKDSNKEDTASEHLDQGMPADEVDS